MRAIQLTEFGGPETLVVSDLPDPVPPEGQQVFVLRAALEHLRDWVVDGTAPPHADPLAIEGKVFNFYNWGGYIDLRTQGRLQVFIDGRAGTVFDTKTYRQYQRVASLHDGWQDMIWDSGADFVKTSTGFSTSGATVHDIVGPVVARHGLVAEDTARRPLLAHVLQPPRCPEPLHVPSLG